MNVEETLVLVNEWTWLPDATCSKERVCEKKGRREDSTRDTLLQRALMGRDLVSEWKI